MMSINTIYKILLLSVVLFSCKQEKKDPLPFSSETSETSLYYAKGFKITKQASGITIITIASPWLNAEKAFTYALIPKEKMALTTLNRDDYDAIIPIPIEKIVVTSTTHIPALESLGVIDKLIGFPSTNFISSKKTRNRIDQGFVQELGSNEGINTELLLSLQPDLVVGFGINSQNKAYETIKRSNIPVVYNGDWTEATPLGKSEWIKFFAPFFGLEEKANQLFTETETSYSSIKKIAQKAITKPTVMQGGLYKDVWYVAGGGSWMGQFLADAGTNYLWKETTETGSLSLSVESVLEKAKHADFWLNPSLHSTQKELLDANAHYRQFDAFKNKNIYTHVNAKGATGGLLFFEIGPSKPDLVLKDLIHIFHPELLPEHEPVFFSHIK